MRSFADTYKIRIQNSYTKFVYKIRAGRFWWRGKPVCENGTGPRLKPRGRNAVSHISPGRSDGRWFWWRGKSVWEIGTGPRLKPRGRNAVSHISPGRSDSRLLMVESHIKSQQRRSLRTDCGLVVRQVDLHMERFRFDSHRGDFANYLNFSISRKIPRASAY